MDKLWLVIICIAILVFMSFLSSRDKKKKIIFFGDSITKAGVQPHGYITLMHNMLEQQNISHYNLIGAGIDGNTVYDLYERADNDVIAKSPNIIVVYIGVNDVWQKMYGSATDANEFEKLYRALIIKLHVSGSKVIVCTPAVIGEKKDFNELDNDLDKYCNIIRKLANNMHLPLVDIREAFVQYEANNNLNNTDKGVLTVDGVHLNDKGNELVAELMWTVIKTL
jgi:lysophospholipase L1-like esterase